MIIGGVLAVKPSAHEDALQCTTRHGGVWAGEEERKLKRVKVANACLSASVSVSETFRRFSL